MEPFLTPKGEQFSIDSEATAIKLAALLFWRDLANRSDHPDTKALAKAAATVLAPPNDGDGQQ